MLSIVLSIYSRIQALWEDVIFPNWIHRNRPRGQRFLGSVCISEEQTTEVFDEVKGILRTVGNITFTNLDRRLGDVNNTWIKVLTFVCSEYAYYYSSSSNGFYEGLCQQLGLSYCKHVEQTFRRIISEGIDLLGLVETHKGYRYVSILWLQSGIPKKNLNHFAQLVHEVANEFGWWEIRHADVNDLSQLLLDYCQNNYSQNLRKFLESSCPKEGDAEPISGQLLQGIAAVAYVLGERGCSPIILQDSSLREQLLQNYYLPNNFFLRDWNNLIQVLTPQSHAHVRQRSIIGRRQKPLSVILDVADSMNIKLLLPAQVLWQSQWSNLQETYCQIPQQGWEGTIPKTGALEIPELTQDIKQIREPWEWHLRSHTGVSLLSWSYEGIFEYFLIFDAWTGCRLSADELRGRTEIICFVAKETRLQPSNGIEILDSFVPCSIPHWRGQQFQLTAQQATLSIYALNQQPLSKCWLKI